MAQISVHEEIKKAGDSIDDIKRCSKCSGKMILSIDQKIKKWEARCINRLCVNFKAVVRKDWE